MHGDHRLITVLYSPLLLSRRTRLSAACICPCIRQSRTEAPNERLAAAVLSESKRAPKDLGLAEYGPLRTDNLLQTGHSARLTFCKLKCRLAAGCEFTRSAICGLSLTPSN